MVESNSPGLWKKFLLSLISLPEMTTGVTEKAREKDLQRRENLVRGGRN